MSDSYLSKDVIDSLRRDKSQITSELLSELRLKGNKGKESALQLLDLDKDHENFCLDAFGQRIAYNGNRSLKKEFTQLNLTDLHIEELKRCAEDIHYYKDNYVKITTQHGTSFPTIRDYQNNFLTTVSGEAEDLLCLMPRQCCSGNTILNIDGRYISFEEFFNSVSNNMNVADDMNDIIETLPGKTLSSSTFRKYTESYRVKDTFILTPNGYKEVEYVHKTVLYRRYKITLNTGIELFCAPNHVIILEDGTEIYAKDSLLKNVKTVFGFATVIRVEDTGILEQMYDISIDSKDELFYSNGILSHNSGKSVSTAIYLSWLYTFKKSINIGVCANAGKTSREFLDKTKKIISFLPLWMQPGTVVWNKSSIENESGIKILTDVPSNSPFRGFSINCLVIDECAFIPTEDWHEFADSVFPSQSGLSWKKNIMISTANGKNHFYDMIKGAKDGQNGMTVFEVDWKDPPRFKKDGSQWGNEEFKQMIIKKNGLIHFNQNYANDFIGSSFTLIDSEIMSKLKASNPLYELDRKLKIYVEPEKNDKYVMTIDSAKGGQDFFAVSIFNVSRLPFVQVAASKIKVNYLIMPSFIYEWAEFYNYAYIIIENNDGSGQSIADILFKEYEYENLHFDKKPGTKIRQNKEYPGFRTTRGNRSTILTTLKSFIDKEKLIIHDADLIEEFNHFLLIDDKFQADSGYHDDLIMSTAILFSLFIDNSNFEDFKSVVSSIYSKDENYEDNISSTFTFGVFDDSPEYNENYNFEEF